MSDPTARALALFDHYVELAADERERALDALSRDDPPLHAALLALLRADTDQSTVLERLPAQVLAGKQPTSAAAGEPGAEVPDPRLGQRLGPWRIDRLIAAGGMGAVYEAHRDDGEYQQRVALKCVRAELASPELVAAFFDERNHLARLDHPGIASLIDGGVADDGQPWFAMRYIEGTDIDRWCDARRAGLAQRVDLLIQAAHALSHAHAQGLLHGDIKPSNLLVTAEGRVQLVDFGISTTFNALQADDSPRLAATADYAAPELRERRKAGPAVDLYALGVLSYRLLSAQWPARLHKLGSLLPGFAVGPAEPMDRLLLKSAAPPRVALERGAADVATLARELAGDLSAIALKAVAAQPQDRYPSISAYADDLQRWRDHRPVQARPVGWPTRARMRLRRHRGATLLTAALLLVLALGLGLTLREHRRAAREADASRTVGHLFASTLGAATLSGLGSTPFSSQRLLARTEADLRKLDLRQHPQLHAQSLATLARSYAMIGDYQHAERLADEAQARLQGNNDDEPDYVYATRLSLLNLQSRHAEAAALARARLVALAERHDAQAHQSKVAIGAELSQAQWGLGDPKAALRTLDLAMNQAQALGSGHDELQAQLLMQRSRFRARVFQLKQAQADAERAIALAQRSNPILADDGRELWLTMSVLYRRTADLALAQRLLHDRRRTLGDRHPKTGRAWILLGYAQYMNGRKVDAQKNLEAGRALIETAYGRDHPEYAVAEAMATSVTARETRDNVRALREALRICQTSLGPRHELSLHLRRMLASRLHDLSPAILQPGDHKEAEALFAYNIRIKREAGIPAPWETLLLAHSLLLHGDNGDLPRVEALLRDSRAQGLRYFEPGDSYNGIVRIFWTRMRYRQGHREEADREFARILEAYRNDTTFFAQLFRHDSWVFRALYAYERCDLVQAKAYLAEAEASELRALGPTHFATRDTQGFLAALRRSGRFANTTGAQVPAKPALDEAQRLHDRACRQRPR